MTIGNCCSLTPFPMRILLPRLIDICMIAILLGATNCNERLSSQVSNNTAAFGRYANVWYKYQVEASYMQRGAKVNASLVTTDANIQSNVTIMIIVKNDNGTFAVSTVSGHIIDSHEEAKEYKIADVYGGVLGKAGWKEGEYKVSVRIYSGDRIVTLHPDLDLVVMWRR